MPTLFRYEIEVGIAPGAERRTVRYEALFHFPHGRPRRLFERRAPGFSVHAAGHFGLKAGDERLKAVRDDASTIATLAAFNVPLAERIRGWLHSVMMWSNVSYDGPWQLPTDLAVKIIQSDSELRGWISDEIRRGDLGIAGVEAVMPKKARVTRCSTIMDLAGPCT